MKKRAPAAAPAAEVVDGPIIDTGTAALADLVFADYNPRKISESEMASLVRSLKRFGFVDPVVVNRRTGDAWAGDPSEGSLVVVGGHQRLRAAKTLGIKVVPTATVYLDRDDEKVLNLALNRISGEWDLDKLAALLKDLREAEADIEAAGFSEAEIQQTIASLEGTLAGGSSAVSALTLQQRFVVPPFTVLDARMGYWRERKAAWIGLGIRGEKGRGENLLKMSEACKTKSTVTPGAIELRRAGGGLLRGGVEVKDPSFYRLKNETEARLGRPLTTAEFREKFWVPTRHYRGTSIFDPVLCELAYRWFSPVGGLVLDPFAGGSVRGAVAGLLGRRYVGIDLSEPQVTENVQQWSEVTARLNKIRPAGLPTDIPDAYLDTPTPVERIEAAKVWVKRDDAFTVANVRGGKARACWSFVNSGPKPAGLVTAGSRQSPQANIVAQIGRRLGIPVRVHTPSGPLTPELEAARAAGAEVVQHEYGRNSVIIARARADAAERGWLEVPFGMECDAAVDANTLAASTTGWEGVKRIVVPVGSGMTLAGIVKGAPAGIPILGITVGADPQKRLDRWAPGWRDRVTLIKSPLDYHAHAPSNALPGITLDPVYEAKCVSFLKPGDLLWSVGIRQTAQEPAPAPAIEAPGRTIRISAKWAAHHIDCTVEGITRAGGCAARCCYGPTYWPGRSGGRADNACAHLGPAGCTLGPADKPVTCHLYPFMLNESGTLVVHHRASVACCKPNVGRGPMIIEAAAPGFVALVGQDETDRIIESVRAGVDPVVTLPADVVAALEREAGWAEDNTIPVPRSHFAVAGTDTKATTSRPALGFAQPPATFIGPESARPPRWILGNSLHIDTLDIGPDPADLLFSCPPYGDLEQYGDSPDDLSNMDHDAFVATYREIIKRACARLRDDSFAVFVVGDYRARDIKGGPYRNFVSETIRAFIDAGLSYYNEAVLATCVGSTPIRVARQFEAARKFGKTHQNVLVFVKGDPVRATERIGPADFGRTGGGDTPTSGDTDDDGMVDDGS